MKNKIQYFIIIFLTIVSISLCIFIIYNNQRVNKNYKRLQNRINTLEKTNNNKQKELDKLKKNDEKKEESNNNAEGNIEKYKIQEIFAPTSCVNSKFNVKDLYEKTDE